MFQAGFSEERAGGLERGQAQDVTAEEEGTIPSLPPPSPLGGWGTVEIDAYIDTAKTGVSVISPYTESKSKC